MSNIYSSSSSIDSWLIPENSSFGGKDCHGSGDSSSEDNIPKGGVALRKSKAWGKVIFR